MRFSSKCKGHFSSLFSQFLPQKNVFFPAAFYRTPPNAASASSRPFGNLRKPAWATWVNSAELVSPNFAHRQNLG